MICLKPCKFRQLKNDITGFTIVELLIALTVFAVLASVITPVFKQGNTYWQITQSRTELRQTLNSALQLMASELRQADPGSIEASEALPELPNGDRPIIKYSVNNGVENRSFSLPRSGKKPLNFNRGGKSITITPATAIDIIEATVEEQPGQPPLYKITIQGEYILPNAVHPDDRMLTVQTYVAPRAELQPEPGSEG